MNADPDMRGDATIANEGRPVVLEPMPPGWWLAIGGTVLAALGPVFGFLVGSMIGVGDGEGLDPIQVWLLVGFLVGGLGVAMALVGAYSIIERRRLAGEPSVDDRAATPEG